MGFTTVDSIHFIERGYEDFDKKMTALGACMEKIPVDDEREMLKFKNEGRMKHRDLKTLRQTKPQRFFCLKFIFRKKEKPTFCL